MKIRHRTRQGKMTQSNMNVQIPKEIAAHSEVSSFGGRWVLGGILIYWRPE